MCGRSAEIVIIMRVTDRIRQAAPRSRGSFLVLTTIKGRLRDGVIPKSTPENRIIFLHKSMPNWILTIENFENFSNLYFFFGGDFFWKSSEYELFQKNLEVGNFFFETPKFDLASIPRKKNTEKKYFFSVSDPIPQSSFKIPMRLFWWIWYSGFGE